jgi:hypothetical protein
MLLSAAWRDSCSIAAFFHYCLLVRRDPELLQGVLSDADQPS